MAPVTSSLAMSDFGLRTDDVKYFHIDSRIQGKGPDRLKYLDIEGRWVLSGKSIPYISSAFNHLQTLNNARVPFREIIDQPLNAIGMIGWTPSSQPIEVPEAPKPKAPTKLVVQPPVFIDEEEVPPSPREVVPHRSAGYGAAHQKRKLSIPDRARSTSPQKPVNFDRYAKYERNRKDSVTRYGTRWGDLGYDTSSPSPTGDDRPPHRTPSLSPRSRDRSLKAELSVRTREEKPGDVLPYRNGGYGAHHVKRQYELSPRSIGSYSSESEQSSPALSEKNTDEVLLLAYHSRGRLPRVH